MSQFSAMAFPPEVYAQIIYEIDDTKSLLALLVTSRTLNHEAERMLYREPKRWLRQAKSPWPRLEQALRHISTCGRVANHVRSIEIKLNPDSAREVLSVTRALNMLKNLKSLALFKKQGDMEPIFSSLVSGISFQLCEFSTNLSIDHQLKSFLQSQPQIRHLRVIEYQYLDNYVTLSRIDLPALTSLDFTDYFNRTQSLFPEFFITNLYLRVFQDLPSPLPAVQALKIHQLEAIRSLSLRFPNLRFLDTRYTYLDLEMPSCLQKLKMWRDDDDPDTNQETLLQIYASHQQLKCLEVCNHENKWAEKVTICRVQERLNPHSMLCGPVSETSIENYLYHESEWVDWQG